jgi:hypothetical protein
MWKWIHALDRILRGDATRLSNLREGRIDIPAAGLTVVLIALGASYGFCMGWFALFDRPDPEYLQVLASMVKVPALFFLTLLVTLPSLYVFNALVGSRLSAGTLLRLLIASLAVLLTVLASFGPIVAFFSLTTTSYPFLVLLNVVLFAVAGVLGLLFLLQTLHRLTLAAWREWPEALPPAREAGPTPAVVEALPAEVVPAGALERVGPGAFSHNVRVVFYSWVVLFALVGAQMSWVLRPFIGSPDRPFQWFRPRESHFFEAVLKALDQLFR